MKAAGQPVNGSTRSYARRWTDTEVLDFVVQYRMADDSRSTYDGYGRWATANGAPSAQTVRNTLGSWSAVKAAALPLIHARARQAG